VSPEQLDLAKSIVLDLLGWGVPPDYLVEFGVSPGTIFKIFTDLRLRLPTNLRVSMKYINVPVTPPQGGGLIVSNSAS
jgi:hypothetical protein